MEKFSPEVADSGEGRWAVRTAVDLGVPAHVFAAALFNRFSSREDTVYANKLQSALRYAFGGHTERAGNEQHGPDDQVLRDGNGSQQNHESPRGARCAFLGPSHVRGTNQND